MVVVVVRGGIVIEVAGAGAEGTTRAGGAGVGVGAGMTVTMRGRVKGVGCATGVCAFVELKEQNGEIINSKSNAYFFISVNPSKKATRFPAASPDKIRARGFRLSNAFLN